MDSIEIRKMQFFGFHGVLPGENQVGQRFLVSLKMYLSLRQAGQTDDLADTVNYAEVFASVRRIVEGPPFKLLERLAAVIAEQLLAEFPCIEGLRVEVEKPGAPIPGVFDSVIVAIERFREA
jgi:dihydroneopterin aldolase